MTHRMRPHGTELSSTTVGLIQTATWLEPPTSVHRSTLSTSHRPGRGSLVPPPCSRLAHSSVETPRTTIAAPILSQTWAHQASRVKAGDRTDRSRALAYALRFHT